MFLNQLNVKCYGVVGPVRIAQLSRALGDVYGWVHRGVVYF